MAITGCLKPGKYLVSTKGRGIEVSKGVFVPLVKCVMIVPDRGAEVEIYRDGRLIMRLPLRGVTMYLKTEKITDFG